MTIDCQRAVALIFSGSTADKGLQVYDRIEAEMKRRYCGIPIHRAFTSQIIIRRLRERDIIAPDPHELLSSLRNRGIREVAILPLLIAPGQEYEKILAVLRDEHELRTVCAAPLLSGDDDIKAVIQALEPEMPDGMPTVIVCHGNKHHDRFNNEIRLFARQVEARRPNVMVATLEGDNPETALLEKVRELAQQAGAVHFIPLMLATGNHVMNGIMGNKPDSWKSLVAAKTTTCSGPAGLNNRILEIYCEHLDAVVAAGFGGAVAGCKKARLSG